MKTNITQALVDEHKLILRMISLLERNAPRTAAGKPVFGICGPCGSILP